MYILAKKNIKCFHFCMFVPAWKSLFNYLLLLPINGGEGRGAGTQGRAILRSKEKSSRLFSYCCSAVIVLLERFWGWMGSLLFCMSWVCAARRSLSPALALCFLLFPCSWRLQKPLKVLPGLPPTVSTKLPRLGRSCKAPQCHQNCRIVGLPGSFRVSVMLCSL